MRLRLGTKLTLGVLLVLAPIVLLEIFAYRDARDRRLEATWRDLAETAEVAALLVDRTLEESLGLARTLAVMPEMRSLSHAEAAPVIEAIFAERPGLANVVLFGPDGRQIAAAVDARSIDVSDRPYFQAAMQQRRAVLSDVLVGRILGRPIVIAAAPVLSSAGEPRGVVTVALRLDTEAARLQRVRLASGRALFVVDPHGALALHTGEGGREPQRTDLSDEPVFVEALARGEARDDAFESPVSGEPRLAVVVRSPQHGWGVGVSWAPDAALAGVRQAYREQIALLLIVAVLSVLGALLVGRFVARPVQALEEHARALARGDLDRRAEIATGDELESLGDAFDAMAASLQEEKRRRQIVMSAVTHDMKNLMTPLATTLWLLQKKLAGAGDEVQKLAARMGAQIRRMNRLVSDLSDAGLAEAGRFPIAPQPGDLVATARLVVDESREALARDIVLEAPDSVPAVFDRDRVAQLLTNFVSNAAKYDPEGKSILVRLAREGDEAILAVVDRGRGLTPEEAARLFRPWSRLPGAEDVRGLGLGLHICKAIAEAHGGRVWVESGGPGEGATFGAALPLVAGRSGADDAAPRPQGSSPHAA